MQLDAASSWLLWSLAVLGALYSVGVSYYLGLKERKRLGVTKCVENIVSKVELSEEEAAWKRPKLIFFNPHPHRRPLSWPVMGLASSAILFGVGTAIALLVNYPNQKTQRQVISSVAPDMINVVMMVLGAGVLMGVLNGPEGAGMSNAIAELLVSIIPESLGSYFAVIIAFISAPGTYLLNNDAFYYGVLPPLAATAQALRVYQPADWLCRPYGPGLPFPEPPGSLHLPADGQDRDHSGSVSGLHLQMVHRHLRDLLAMGFVTGSLAIL